MSSDTSPEPMPEDTPALPSLGTCVRILALALGLTVAQVAFCIAVGGVGTMAGSYHGLAAWDTKWYLSIAGNGYTNRALPPRPDDADYADNVAFFPGYPLAVRATHTLFGGALDWPLAALVTAQALCVTFWAVFLLYLHTWRVRPRLAAAVVVAAAAHPAAFFLVAGYSESLFLTVLLGMFWCARSERPMGRVLTVLCGVAMTATRIVGVPLAFVPALATFLERRPPPWRRVVVLLMVGVVSCLGAAAFFMFCAARFGAWNLYFQSQAVGWRVVPLYLAPFNPLQWYEIATSPLAPDRVWVMPGLAHVLAGPLVALALTALVGWELTAGRRADPEGWRVRAAFYAAATGILYIHAAGTASNLYQSMLRYSLVAHVLLALAVAHRLNRTGASERWAAWTVALSIVGFILQSKLVWRYLNQGFVG